jgi:U6 snRNA phosphodiesterase
LTELIAALKDGVSSQAMAVDIHSFMTSDLGAPLPLHISLSRPIGFLTDQKDAFVASLDHAIKASGIRP